MTNWLPKTFWLCNSIWCVGVLCTQNSVSPFSNTWYIACDSQTEIEINNYTYTAVDICTKISCINILVCQCVSIYTVFLLWLKTGMEWCGVSQDWNNNRITQGEMWLSFCGASSKFPIMRQYHICGWFVPDSTWYALQPLDKLLPPAPHKVLSIDLLLHQRWWIDFLSLPEVVKSEKPAIILISRSNKYISHSVD